ncbi:NfeD family protein [Ornithinimicrobium cryptoxanthini]|uniref:NfeD family protein n=1 Tax=Ornithinimicrobium cryptoxanthini TaxID=2934161 RepID=A0ABY4YGT0_9MICO|nr:NfeD family protein [Ornithinimicrobium cryptoxanthini]USQ75953.1 NfeD family protein [Ornithinimicrobium cryptoxanthini]
MEWLRETQWLWWIAGALVLGLIEIASLDLVFFMLAVAAVAAAVAAGLDQSITVQVLTFVATAALLLAVLRPVALRKIKPEGEGDRTNADALVGRTAVVLQEVTDRTGLVKLTGEEWTARTTPGTVLAVDQTVQVVRIEGATAVVESTAAASAESASTDAQRPGHDASGNHTAGNHTADNHPGNHAPDPDSR